MGRGNSWTHEEKELLAKHLERGMTAYEVHKKEGWAYSSTKKMAAKLLLGVTEARHKSKK